MKKTYPIKVLIIVSIVLAGTWFGFYYAVKIDLGQAERLVVEFNKSEGLTPRAEKILYDFDRLIKRAKFLAQLKLGTGYVAMEKIVKGLIYCEETETTFEEAYGALGYIGRIDKKGLKLLLSEFNPDANPVRAMNVLVGIKLSGDKDALSKCISQIVPNYMSSEEVYARLQNY